MSIPKTAPSLLPKETAFSQITGTSIPIRKSTPLETIAHEEGLKKMHEEAHKVESIAIFCKANASKWNELDKTTKEGLGKTFEALSPIDKMRVLKEISLLDACSFFMSKLPEDMERRYMEIVKPNMDKYGHTKYRTFRPIAIEEYIRELATFESQY
jgi:hypothetical protein